MKKVHLLILSLFIINSLYSQNFQKNKYSTEIDCEYPATWQQTARHKSAVEDIDLLRYKTIIRNGIIEEIEKPYLNDLLLGALTKTELKLFRNMFYAKKGYIFSDEDLTKYFKQFEWYKPNSKDVSFTDLETTAINKIKLFENESTVKYEFEGKDIIWEQWNGGANERGPLFKLNKDYTFEYTPWQTLNRLKKIQGKWTIENNKLILLVENEAVVFGGYDDAYNIAKGTPVTIQYTEPLKISLPLNESEADKKYNLTWSKNWIKMGSVDCYVSN